MTCKRSWHSIQNNKSFQIHINICSNLFISNISSWEKRGIIISLKRRLCVVQAGAVISTDFLSYCMDSLQVSQKHRFLSRFELISSRLLVISLFSSAGIHFICQFKTIGLSPYAKKGPERESLLPLQLFRFRTEKRFQFLCQLGLTVLERTQHALWRRIPR